MYPALALLARGRFLRGTMFDVFGYTKERRLERQLVDDFCALVLDTLVPALNTSNVSDAAKVAEAAQAIRGFGHVKLNSVAVARQRKANALRSEARRVGKECVSPCRSRWAPSQSKQNHEAT